MRSEPEISVILPACNEERYLPAAVESILNQTFQDFELIVIDDGSSDNTWEIVRHYQKKDSRVVPLKNSTNQGLVRSLNRGIEKARGKYIARQDADDLSLPERFARQRDFLKKAPGYGIVGSAMEVIDSKDRLVDIYRQPETDMEIRFRLLLNAPFVHTSVFLLKSVLDKNGLFYDAGYNHVEDYHLWTRYLKFTKGYNFQYPLVKYRVLETSVSNRHKTAQARAADAISSQALEQLGISFRIPAEKKAHMLEIYRRYLISEIDTLTVADQDVVPALLHVTDAFINAHHVTEKRLLAFRNFLSHEAKTEGTDPRNRLACLEQIFSRIDPLVRLKARYPHLAYGIRKRLRNLYKKTTG